MDVTYANQPGNTVARIDLQPGEICTAEAGAMIAMSEHMKITTSTHKKGKGGLLKSIKRALAGESFFLNHFEPAGQPGELWLGTNLSGDMMTYELDNESLIVQAGSFVAAEHDIDIDLGWQGFKSILSGESVFWLNLSGKGTVILSSFGAIYPIEVNGEHIVDTGHIVAFNETLSFSITKAGKSWIGSMLSGEGLVCRFEGQGTVWCQSHNAHSFGKSLTPILRPRG